MNIRIVGCGALGASTAVLLAQQGTRALELQDFDIVQDRNLPAGTYAHEDIGARKVDALARHLARVNPKLEIRTIPTPFTRETALSGLDLLIDCTDTMETRSAITRAARSHDPPLAIVHAAAATRNGRVLTSAGNACWECVTHGKIATGDCNAGIDPRTIATVARATATDALRVLAHDPREGLLVISDERARTVHAQQRDGCPGCTGAPGVAIAQQRCDGTGRIHVRLGHSITLARVLHATGESVAIATYPSAVLVALGTGKALVHKHGLIEFEGVERDAADAFIARVRAASQPPK